MPRVTGHSVVLCSILSFATLTHMSQLQYEIKIRSVQKNIKSGLNAGCVTIE